MKDTTHSISSTNIVKESEPIDAICLMLAPVESNGVHLSTTTLKGMLAADPVLKAFKLPVSPVCNALMALFRENEDSPQEPVRGTAPSERQIYACPHCFGLFEMDRKEGATVCSQCGFVDPKGILFVASWDQALLNEVQDAASERSCLDDPDFQNLLEHFPLTEEQVWESVKMERRLAAAKVATKRNRFFACLAYHSVKATLVRSEAPSFVCEACHLLFHRNIDLRMHLRRCAFKTG